MATAETVELGPSHKPKEASINAFNDLLSELKHELGRLRHEYDSRCPLPPLLKAQISHSPSNQQS